MIGLRNATYYATIPVNLILIGWVWTGRIVFGAVGWYFLLFLTTVIPVLLVALGITSGLAIAQRLPSSTGRLTVPQFWSLIGVWVSMVGFGFFIVDFGDSTDSDASAFSRIVGRGALDTSYMLSDLFFVLIIGSYAVLLVLLILGMPGRRERRALELQQLSPNPRAPWPLPNPPHPNGPQQYPAQPSGRQQDPSPPFGPLQHLAAPVLGEGHDNADEAKERRD